MCLAAFLPWPTATVTLRSAGTMSPPANTPGRPVIMSRVDLHHAVAHLQARHAVEQREVDVLAEREHQRVGLQRLELAGGLRLALVVEHHLLDRQLAGIGLADGGQPLDRHALLQRLLDLEVVRRHAVARAAVDDHRLGGAEAPGGARHVDRGVAAAVDDDAAAEHRLVLALHAAQHRHRIEHARRVAGRDEGALGDVRADGEEGRVDALRAPSSPAGRRPSRRSGSPRPCATMRATSASSTSRGSRYLGMPKRIMPPGSGPASSTVTRWPRRRRW